MYYINQPVESTIIIIQVVRLASGTWHYTYIVLKQGRGDTTVSSVRSQANYTHNQGRSTSAHLLLRHPLLHLNIIRFFVHIVFYGILRLVVAYPPPKGNLVLPPIPNISKVWIIPNISKVWLILLVRGPLGTVDVGHSWHTIRYHIGEIKKKNRSIGGDGALSSPGWRYGGNLAGSYPATG